MKYLFALLLVATVLPLNVMAQEVNYDDVAVIINLNSADSQEIGTYFAEQRNVPERNIIKLYAPTTEQISPDEFALVRAQIEQHLVDSGLVDAINYIVTTKDIPLRIGTSACDDVNDASTCAALDSELCLLLGPYAGSIGLNGGVFNPFLGSNAHHDRSTHGLYLVTRLDGFKTEQVLDLIDRSGPGTEVVQGEVTMLGDVNWNWDQGSLPVFQFQLGSIMDPLASAGWNTLIDTTALVVQPTEDLIGYVSIHSSPTLGIPELPWVPGGVAMEWSPFSAFSFNPDVTIAMHVRTAERIREGASGASGNVTSTFAGPNSDAYRMWTRYLDTSYHFNLAESFYAGAVFLSYTVLYIGDPKTSIRLVLPTGIQDREMATDLVAFPNPSNGVLTLQTTGEAFRIVRVTDQVGRTLLEGSPILSAQHRLDLSAFAPGTYLVQVETDKGVLRTLRSVIQR